ncbi:hypothetical protein GQ43DRAFT_394800, partial [Delitschia confertaspora ATCC 74209]
MNPDTLDPRFPDWKAGSVTVHALSSGHFTLPEYQFIHPVSRDARKTVPSLAFLIQHRNVGTQKLTRIIFDLGLRRDIKRYAEPIQKHITTRQPLTTDPDVVKSLAKGGLTPDDIDFVILSHVHWDHIGEPLDFPKSSFIVGHGALSLLKDTSSALRGGHSFFEPDLLPEDRTIELSDPTNPPSGKGGRGAQGELNVDEPWKPHHYLPHTLDLFNDGSLLIVDAPGHLPGHINLLARICFRLPLPHKRPLSMRYMYLGGDACHDRRLLTGEKKTGEWEDAQGHVCCIHADKKMAEETIGRIKRLEEDKVEVVFSHDREWEVKNLNTRRFWG